MTDSSHASDRSAATLLLTFLGTGDYPPSRDPIGETASTEETARQGHRL